MGASLSWYEEKCKNCLHLKVCESFDDMKSMIECDQYEPPRTCGEWIKTIIVEEPKKNKRSYAKCSSCGVYFRPFSFADREFYFCPKCGSDNRKRSEVE